MNIISNETIEKVFAFFIKDQTVLEKWFDEMKTEQPHWVSYIGYLINKYESKPIRNFVFYMSMIIWKSYKMENENLPEIKAESFLENEKIYWEAIEKLSKKEASADDAAFNVFKDLHQPNLIDMLTTEIDQLMKMEEKDDAGTFFIHFQASVKACNDALEQMEGN